MKILSLPCYIVVIFGDFLFCGHFFSISAFKNVSFLIIQYWGFVTQMKLTNALLTAHFKKIFITGLDQIRLCWRWCKFSKHLPSGPMLSISRNVCLSFRLCVCSLLRYRLSVILPPLPEVRCPVLLEIWNPWGKVMERSGLRLEHFCLEVV